MEAIKKLLKLNSNDFYCKHLEIINPMLPLPLTPKEIEVLGAFMSLEGDIVEKDRFGTSCRKEVKNRLGLSDGGLGNYIKALKVKDIILTNKDEIMFINPLLMTKGDSQVYMFKIEKE